MLIWMLGVSVLVMSSWNSVTALDFVYHHQTEMEKFLRDISTTYPDLAKLYSIGQSIEGRELWVIALGKSANEDVLLRPNVKYIGNMHGNEVVSREVLLHLIDYLATNYSTNSTVQNMLDTMLIHIMPTMNPDGFEIAYEGNCSGVYGRANSAYMDLNRNFPDKFETNTAPRQPETTLVMEWLKQYQFLLSANLHGGAMLANYPYDNYINASIIQEVRYARCPDDDVFVHISKVYSMSHGNMYLGEHCGDNFTDGITNGAMWYPVIGGMQDYNYVEAGCFEITLEIGCCKYPLASELPQFWRDNKDALVNYLKLGSTMGVKGLVKDAQGDPISGAVVKVLGREDFTATTTPKGEYWRLLLPGQYTLVVDYQHFKTSQTFTVEADTVTIQDITMTTVNALSTGCIWTSYLPCLILNTVFCIAYLMFQKVL